ncbi:MAG: hypothetical protein JW958_06370 [Candidatus Eisenbacteria bacterium]|nr:hypothetical protein [Candidatus Eisenbacteria bacterium]
MTNGCESGEGRSFERILGTVLFWILVAFLLTGLFHIYAIPLGRWVRGSL